jgi:hypothetical protein
MSTTKAKSDGDGGAQQTNTIQGDANVGLVAGVIHGDTHFYQLRDETPEEKYRVGCNYLNGHVQAPAEKLICAAFMSGKAYQNADVAYHWALAILSGRTFEQLTQDDFTRLSTAFQYAGRPGDDGLAGALAVVSRLIDCLLKQDQDRTDVHEGAQLDQVLASFEALPFPRREEIHRHLEMILAGGIQDRLEAGYASELHAHRMSNNRRNRAWKFFEPDPTPPLRRDTPPVRVAMPDKVALAIGVLIAGAAVVLLLPVLAQTNPILMPLALLACGAGVAYTGAHGLERAWRSARFRAIRLSRTKITESDRPDDERERDFATDIERTIDFELDYFKWHHVGRSSWKQWDKDIKGIRNALCRELTDTYKAQSDIQKIRWLIRWHARRTFLAWKRDVLPDPYEGLRPPSVRPIVIGVLVSIVGGCVASIAAIAAAALVTLLAGALIIIAATLSLPAATRIHVERRRHATDLHEAAHRYREHFLAYQSIREALADTPDDSEMARWLDHDKAYVKALALRYYKMTNRNVFAHAVVSQAAVFCRAARVNDGPPRYSANRVLVFLFTDGGVCQITIELSFLTGELRNEKRVTFNYDAITSAWTNEIGVRLDGETPSSSSTDVDQSDKNTETKSSDGAAGSTTRLLVVSRNFRLSLENKESITFNVQNFYEDVDQSLEIQHDLLQLALDVAGSGALWLMEVVAAEGKDWIARERKRRERRLTRYRQASETHPAEDIPHHTANGHKVAAVAS